MTYQAAGRRTVPAWLAVGGALALVLGGCGTQDGGAGGSGAPAATTAARLSPAQAVQAAANTTKEKSTAQVAMTLELSVFGKTSKSSGNGQIDVANQASAMTITAKALKGGGTEKTKFVTVEEQDYVKHPGKPWIKLKPGQVEELGTDQESQDPSAFLEMLKQDSDDVEEAGRVTVNDVETTKYTGTFREDDETGPMRFEVYVDDEGLPSRMMMEALESGTEAGGETGDFTFKVTIDFTDWGAPVSIKPPKGAVSPEEANVSLSD